MANILSGIVKDSTDTPVSDRTVRAYREDTGALIGSATTTIGQAAQVGDPYWNDVVLAMHMNGRDTTEDPHANSVVLNMRMNSLADDTGKTVTAVGNAAISTAQSKFGGASAYFDGNGDYLSIAQYSDFALGSGDFTIEYWSWRSGTKADAVVFATSVDGSANGGWWVEFAADNFRMYGPASTLVVGASAVGSADSAWHHWAITRAGTTVRAFKDGSVIATSTSAINLIASNANVGGTPTFGGFDPWFNGYIDDLRITKGVARYTANFTPPTTELPTAYPLFKDEKGKTVTAFGNAAISTAQAKFGGASAYFDGSGDYIVVGDSPDWDFPGDFTIETWVYRDSLSSGAFLSTRGNNAGFGMVIWLAATTVTLYWSSTGGSWDIFSGSTWTIPSVNGDWHHIALVRAGNNLSLFLDGQKQGTDKTITAGISSAQNFTIGRDSGWGADFKGYIDDLRITKGVARYTADFTPPTQPFLHASGLELSLGGYHIDTGAYAGACTLVFSGEPNRNALVLSGVIPVEV